MTDSLIYQFYDLDRKSDRFLTRSMRINRTLKLLKHRFKQIRSFEPTKKVNITLDDDKQLRYLKGYRIVLNHSPSNFSSFFLILFCLLFIYWWK